MWLCTKHGFYSIVKKRADEVHIRARCRQDLVNLRKLASRKPGFEAAAKWEIFKTDPADYRFRLVVNSTELVAVMIVIGESLDYSNFKGVIGRTPDQSGKLGIYTAFHHDLEDWQNAS